MLLKIVKSSNVALLVFLLTTNNLVYAQGSGLDLNPGQKMETDGSTFLFGQSMSSVDTDSGSSITRAGFGTNMSSENTNSSSRLSTNQLSSMLTRLEQRPTEGNQGNPNPTPALAGQLISTGNTQGGSSSPDGNLSGDRLTKSYDTQTYGFQPIHSSDSQTNQQPLPKTTPPTAPTPTLPVVQAPAPNPQPPQPRTPPTAPTPTPTKNSSAKKVDATLDLPTGWTSEPEQLLKASSKPTPIPTPQPPQSPQPSSKPNLKFIGDDGSNTTIQINQNNNSDTGTLSFTGGTQLVTSSNSSVKLNNTFTAPTGPDTINSGLSVTNISGNTSTGTTSTTSKNLQPGLQVSLKITTDTDVQKIIKANQDLAQSTETIERKETMLKGVQQQIQTLQAKTNLTDAEKAQLASLRKQEGDQINDLSESAKNEKSLQANLTSLVNTAKAQEDAKELAKKNVGAKQSQVAALELEIKNKEQEIKSLKNKELTEEDKKRLDNLIVEKSMSVTSAPMYIGDLSYEEVNYVKAQIEIKKAEEGTPARTRFPSLGSPANPTADQEKELEKLKTNLKTTNQELETAKKVVSSDASENFVKNAKENLEKEQKKLADMKQKLIDEENEKYKGKDAATIATMKNAERAQLAPAWYQIEAQEKVVSTYKNLVSAIDQADKNAKDRSYATVPAKPNPVDGTQIVTDLAKFNPDMSRIFGTALVNQDGTRNTNNTNNTVNRDPIADNQNSKIKFNFNSTKQ